MAGQTIDITVADGARLTGYLTVPPNGSGPGIILLPRAGRLDAPVRGAADLFAEEGYVVLAPDLSWSQNANNEQALSAVAGSLQVLRGRPECVGKVAALGFSLGGLLAYLTAVRLGVDAAIAFDALDIDQHIDEGSKLSCPLLLHFGGADTLNPPEKVQRLRQLLAGRTDVSILVHPDADHGFYLPGFPEYNRLAAQMAHSPTIGLLRRVLGPRYDLNAMWEKHCEYEFATRSADHTMATMVAEPYVNHIPTMTGGFGHEELHRFYQNHFIPRLPKDTRLVPISRTIGADRVVDELLFCFTHDVEIDFMLPGVPPTGRYVEVPTVAIVCFRGDKLYHEHIYWDQASLLVQIGLLDPKNLPVAGIETARKVADPSRASNTLMARWRESAPSKR